MGRSDLRGEAQFRKFWDIRFFVTSHIFLTDRIWSQSPHFGRPKHGQKRAEEYKVSALTNFLVHPTFHIASLNRYTPKFSGVP